MGWRWGWELAVFGRIRGADGHITPGGKKRIGWDSGSRESAAARVSNLTFKIMCILSFELVDLQILSFLLLFFYMHAIESTFKNTSRPSKQQKPLL